jgi:hypothetical protein
MQIDPVELLLYVVGVVFSIMVSIIGYYLKETLSTIRVLNNGQDEIKSSLVRIETDLLNMKDNYSVLNKRADIISEVIQEHSIKIAKLEEKVNNKSRVA